MRLSDDTKEWKDTEERELASMIEKGVPYTGGESPCSEQIEPKRPEMRPRVRQLLSASAMAGYAFCTLAMIVLTVSACLANPDIAIHPTAIQLDPVTRARCYCRPT